MKDGIDRLIGGKLTMRDGRKDWWWMRMFDSIGYELEKLSRNEYAEFRHMWEQSSVTYRINKCSGAEEIQYEKNER